MSSNRTIDAPPRAEASAQAPVTAAEWFAGGHLTTGEHPDLLAAAIRTIAERHGVGTPSS